MNYSVNKTVIENYMKENKLTKTRFCKSCNICVSTFNKIMSGESVKITAFFRIARTMGIRICNLFE